jgi:hypothetical protein
MATDGPDPDPCDSEVYRHGRVVLQTHSISSNRMERWVKKIAAESGQRVDWHFAGGFATVRALGNIRAVNAAIQNNADDLERLRAETVADDHGRQVK